MRDVAEAFLSGELTASSQIIMTGIALALVALACLVAGLRGRSRWRTGLGVSLALFAALALFGGFTYRGTVQGLLETVPSGFTQDVPATAQAELARMTTGVNRLEQLVRFVWPSLIAGGLLIATVLRRRARALSGAALGIALGSVLTLSIDIVGIHRSAPYEEQLRGPQVSSFATR